MRTIRAVASKDGPHGGPYEGRPTALAATARDEIRGREVGRRGDAEEGVTALDLEEAQPVVRPP